MTGQISRQSRLLAASVLALVAALAAPTSAGVLSSITGAIPGGGFSVSGKTGPFIDEAARRKPEAATVGADEVRGFGGDSQGEFQSARISMPKTQAALEAVLQRDDALWTGPHPGPIKVHILADGKFGPNALPDGSVVVPIGFLVRAESDDEVAFVLAHEYSHLALSHFGRSTQMRNQRKFVSTLVRLYAAGVMLSELRAQQVGQQTNIAVADQKRVNEARLRAAGAKDQLDWVMNNLIEPNWSRRQEDEADALGYDLASRQRYGASDGAGAAFARLTADDESRAQLVTQLQTQIHTSLGEAAAKNGQQALQTGDPSAFLNTFKKSLIDGVTDRAVGAAQAWLSAQHRPPAARQKGLGDYIRTAYHADPPLVGLQTKWLDGVRATPEFRTAKTAVYALQSAQKSRADGNFDAALKSIKTALATPYGALPLFSNEAGRIYRDKGDLKSAEAAFTRADANSGQTLDGFRDHVQMEMRHADYRRALVVIDLYKSRSKTDKDFLPQLIRISFKLNETEKALAFLQRCLDLEEPALRQSCALNAYGPDDAEWDKLPEATQNKIKRMTGKAASELSVGTGFSGLFKMPDPNAAAEKTPK